jgi:hypothetical protein
MVKNTLNLFHKMRLVILYIFFYEFNIKKVYSLKMTARSRLQAPFKPDTTENPYLKPLPPQVDPFGSRGRFQQVNLGAQNAENRTKIPFQSIVEEMVVPAEEQTESDGQHVQRTTKTTTTTTVVED